MIRTDRPALLAAMALLFVGCASTERVSLPTSGVSPAAFDLADGREAAAIGGGFFRLPGEDADFLGDDRFTPSRIAMLGGALQDCCRVLLAGRRVVATAFEVSVRKTTREPFGSMPGYLPSTGNLGADIVGRLLGGAAIAGIEALRGDRRACALVRVEVGEDSYSASACEPTGVTDQSTAIRKSMSNAIAKLSADIRDQPPRLQ